MKFEIKNRWTGKVQYSCELSAEVADKSYGVQLGFAVKSAVRSGSDLSGSDLRGSDLSGSDLSGSDLSGSDLSGSDLSGSDLRGSNLRGSDLRDSNLIGSDLSDSDLSGSDLRGSNLSGSDLRGSDLRGSNLIGSNLSGSDLRGSNLSGCPVKIPDIHKAVHAAASQPQALDMKSWHTCDTTHCRAGWVVRLAGEGGAALEYAIGTPAAAALIYMASDPALERIPDFYCDNEAAMADMARLAEITRVSTVKYNSNAICRHFYAELRKRLAASLESAPALQAAMQIPEGWVLVPREPTTKMLDAMHDTDTPAMYADLRLIYAAMIESAPPTTAETGEA